MLDLDSLVRRTNAMEPLPSNSIRLARILAQEDWKLEDVTACVALDPALTVRVLRAANSAAYSSSSTVATVPQALMRIGSGMLVTLAVGPAVRGLLQSRSSSPRGQALWEHSVATALAADLLRLVISDPVPPEAFPAALLHDVGHLILATQLDAKQHELVLRAEAEGHLERRDAERELFGVDHAELGGLVAERWGLPRQICRAISFHHDPDDVESEYQRTVDVVAVADRVARAAGFDGGETLGDSDPTAAARARLGLTDEAVAELRELVTERFHDVMHAYE